MNEEKRKELAAKQPRLDWKQPGGTSGWEAKLPKNLEISFRWVKGKNSAGHHCIQLWKRGEDGYGGELASSRRVHFDSEMNDRMIKVALEEHLEKSGVLN